MRLSSRRVSIVLGMTAILLVAGLALAGPAGGGRAAVSASPVLAAPTANAPVSTAGTANPAGIAASNALSESQKLGVSPHDVFVPRASATAAQIAQSKAQGYVTPLYTGIPAPAGLGYFGLSAGSHGQVVPTTVSTTSLRGQVDEGKRAIQPSDLFQSSPDSYGIQLNAVQNNVTLFGNNSYSFWTQNVVEYYATSDFLVLVTNVWNFSSPTASMTSNSIYAHGPYGTNEYGLLGYYYAEAVIPAPVSAPFNLTLWMNSSLVGGRDSVTFSVAVTSTSFSFAAPYDYVVFNSTAMGGSPLTAPANYVANGYNYNPLGLTDDFELIFGGPGGGSQADIGQAYATLGLSYWTGGGYQDVPAAFNYGGETGETVTGVNIAWSDGGYGPSGTTNYGILSNGPMMLRGLWNAGGPEGATRVDLGVSPGNAWYEFTPVATSADKNFLTTETIATPAVYGQTFHLTPGTYRVTVGLADYSPVKFTLTVGSAPISMNIGLRLNLLEGIYTPLWAFTNAQLAAISITGFGFTYSPYVLFNNIYAPLGPEFGLYNDYAFPVYPGVFLHGTTAPAYVYRLPSLTADTNTFQFPGKDLPATNQLQDWFWGVSHVGLQNDRFSGWFSDYTYTPAVFDTFNVIFYESSYNLVASNDFATQAQALLMFSGGTIFGPINVGGGNNTIWGNRFTEVAPPASSYPILASWEGLNVGLGIELAEQNDLVYNNYVATPTTAWMLPLNLYSGDAFLYTDTWNIAPQSAMNVHYAKGFPLTPLTGSITGSAKQGGNFWWDYGKTNPYNGAVNTKGVLPYVENANTWILYVYGPSFYYATFIYNGGDNAPLP